MTDVILVCDGCRLDLLGCHKVGTASIGECSLYVTQSVRAALLCGAL